MTMQTFRHTGATEAARTVPQGGARLLLLLAMCHTPGTHLLLSFAVHSTPDTVQAHTADTLQTQRPPTERLKNKTPGPFSGRGFTIWGWVPREVGIRRVGWGSPSCAVRGGDPRGCSTALSTFAFLVRWPSCTLPHERVSPFTLPTPSAQHIWMLPVDLMPVQP